MQILTAFILTKTIFSYGKLFKITSKAILSQSQYSDWQTYHNKNQYFNLKKIGCPKIMTVPYFAIQIAVFTV